MSDEMHDPEDRATLGKFTRLMSEAFRAWDEDQDSRVGRMLAAFAGQRGYMAEIDELRDVIGTIEECKRWADHLSAELNEGDSWAWIRAKFENASPELRYVRPRRDNLSGTRYEVMGWLHCLFGDAQYKNLSIQICVEQQKKADDAEKRAEAAEAHVAALTGLLREARNSREIILYVGEESRWCQKVDALIAPGEATA
jgi:hypothetical protein